MWRLCITGATQAMTKMNDARRMPQPPGLDLLPFVNARPDVAHWLEHYWQKLKLPPVEARRLAVTDDRREFHLWTGRRLNPLALGCYCYLPNASTNTDDTLNDLEPTSSMLTAPAAAPDRVQLALPGFMEMDTLTPPSAGDTKDQRRERATDYRHLIFVEPDLLPLGIEVTVAHELIHLSDRVQGNPRKHHCHGYDSISVDEAAITGRDPELLRAQLREETARREETLRQLRPYRYLYVCPSCGKEYPRVKRYARPVSCGRCDRHYNAAFLLELRTVLNTKSEVH